jgi:hypothetical protein
VVIGKKKLLWLLGWAYDRPAAWKDLLSHWVGMGHAVDSLYGFEMWDKIVLTMKPPSGEGWQTKWEPVAVWAPEDQS